MKRIIPLFVALVLVSAFTVCVGAATSFDKTYNYSESRNNDGIVDKFPTAVTEAATFDGNASLKVTPNPEGAPEKPISLDHYSIASYSMSAADLKYISVYCYYAGNTGEQPYVHVMKQKGENVLRAVVVPAIETPVTGRWQWLTFDVGSALYGNVAKSGAIFSQFHYFPYGTTHSGDLLAGDAVYIAKVRYTSYDKLSSAGLAKYPIRFANARPDVVGEDPGTVYTELGSTVTIPQNPYTREGYTFAGWICSANGKTYQPGETYTVTERKRTQSGIASSSYVTGEAIFFPEWTYSGSTVAIIPDVLTVNYTDFCNGVVERSDAAVVTKDFYFEGRRTLKIEPNKSSSNPVNLDSWSWNNVPLDIDKYKYAVISYYYESDSPANIVPILRVLPGSTNAVAKEYLISADAPLVSGSWGFMTFDLSSTSSVLNPSLSSHIVNQLHLRFSNSIAANKVFSGDDSIYIDTVTFLAEKPEGRLVQRDAVMKGSGDGLFRPRDTLTRAEAAQLAYNILLESGIDPSFKPSCSFKDVSEADWFYSAAATLESIGILPTDGLFRPNDKITHSELALWLTNLSLGTKKKAASFGVGNTQPITRGEVAAMLFDFLGLDAPDAIDSVMLNLYDDVSPSIWEYKQIMTIATPRVSEIKADGSEKIIYFLTNGYTSDDYNTLKGYEKIREFDKQEEKRIAEIRSTESVYSTRGSGKIYYVSSTVGSRDGGSSEQDPLLVTTLAEVSTLLSEKSGDVILFKRGDTFRGQLTTTAGVTYSAYGDIADGKPIFIRSPKNYADASLWTEHSNVDGKIIWKIENIPGDVGAIVVDDGVIVGVKEIPSYLNGGYYLRSNSSKPFNEVTELDINHEFFHKNPPTGSGERMSVSVSSSGTLYFRCDEGNPGEIYSDIEFNVNGNLIAANSNVTIDNIFLKYFGSHGVGAGTVQNLKVTNCEIGFGGGSIQYYTKSTGKVTRFGNGIEIYGGLLNFEIDNCYVYQIYDAGITHQISNTPGTNHYMRDVYYTNNVLCDSTYNIEYFMSTADVNSAEEKFMENIVFDSNLIRRAGYGWGQQRPDPAPAGIKGWRHHNLCFGFIMRDNIVDRCYNNKGGEDYLMLLGSTHNGSTVYLDSNIFIQVPGRDFAISGKYDTDYTLNLPNVLSRIGGRNNLFYFAPEDNGKRFY